MASFSLKLQVFMFVILTLFLGVLALLSWSYASKTLQSTIEDYTNTLALIRNNQLEFSIVSEINQAKVLYNRGSVLGFLTNGM